MSWTTPYTVAYENDAIRVLAFRVSLGTPILIVPPQAGHESWIADYAEGQSLVVAALEASDAPVFAIDYKSCTYARKDEGIEALMLQLTRAITESCDLCDNSYRVHLVGLCQGGWVSTIYAALYPSEVASLTVAGAPIDAHAGDSILAKAIASPMWQYQMVIQMGGGLMHGDFMLANWKAPNAKRHYIDRYLDPTERNVKFYSWYDKTSNIAGGWYLWCIENLFKNNDLINNRMTVGGESVLLERIDCPVYLIAGERDDISPPEQTFNLSAKTSGGYSCILIPKAGHIGVFMGPESVPVWKDKVFSNM
jgi:poly(3-hydroxyalkanoate) synthetase